MNIKHNKKRNTAFLYEILVREVAKAVYNAQGSYKKLCLEILTSNFTEKSVLTKDYQCYKPLYENMKISEPVANRLILELKGRRDKIDKKKLFNAQTALIAEINKKLSPEIWANFVPEYRFMGTLYQYFNGDQVPAKTKAILEESIVKRISSPAQRKNDLIESVDSITYNIYVKKFNEIYGKQLNERQKTTIKNYIFSIEDSGVSFKLFLNEEIGRLKKEIKTTCDGPNSVCDLEINEKIGRVQQLLESYKTKPISQEKIIPQILKIQGLVAEMNSTKETDKND